MSIRKKKKEEAKKAEQAVDSEDDCSAAKCRKPTGKQVRRESLNARLYKFKLCFYSGPISSDLD